MRPIDGDALVEWNVGNMPPEHDSIFKKLYGTDKWRDVFFLRTSDEVLVTIKAGEERIVNTAHTIDGEWKLKYITANPDWEVIAWANFPEPYIEMREKRCD